MYTINSNLRRVVIDNAVFECRLSTIDNSRVAVCKQTTEAPNAFVRENLHTFSFTFLFILLFCFANILFTKITPYKMLFVVHILILILTFGVLRIVV